MQKLVISPVAADVKKNATEGENTCAICRFGFGTESEHDSSLSLLLHQRFGQGNDIRAGEQLVHSRVVIEKFRPRPRKKLPDAE